MSKDKELSKIADWNVVVRVYDEGRFYVELSLSDFIHTLLDTLGLELKGIPKMYELVKKEKK